MHGVALNMDLHNLKTFEMMTKTLKIFVLA